MKLKAFTIAESIMVLVLSAIVFYLVLNAHQLINSLYSVYVTNGKKIESLVELDRFVEHEVFNSTNIQIVENRILFDHDARQVIMNIEDENVRIGYWVNDQQINVMDIPIQMQIGDVDYNKEEYLTALEIICNYDGENHNLNYTKDYTSVQRLRWRQNGKH